jgi:hypothetical protein
MRNLAGVAVFLALLGWVGISNADIVGFQAMDDGDGALVCASTFDYGTYTLSITGNQYWSPGHVGVESLNPLDPLVAYFQTDTELDPTVTMRNTIDNDTGSSWTGYHVNVYMDKPFDLLNPVLVWYPSTSESGWSGSITVTPAVQIGFSPDVWQAQLDYVGGTPIPDGGVLDFSYKMSFVGTVHYCQEMIPIPEPGTFALVLCGLAGLVVVRRGIGS